VGLSVPDRGDVIMVNLEPRSGREQAKRRPGLVVSPAQFNEAFGVAFIAPITSRASRNVFEVPLPEGLEVQGSVLAHQLKSLDWNARAAKHVGRAPNEIVDRVAAIVKEIVT
jgi:mRNA interferase MazF